MVGILPFPFTVVIEIKQYPQLQEIVGYLDPKYAIKQWGPTRPQYITVMSIIIMILWLIEME